MLKNNRSKKYKMNHSTKQFFWVEYNWICHIHFGLWNNEVTEKPLYSFIHFENHSTYYKTTQEITHSKNNIYVGINQNDLLKW